MKFSATFSDKGSIETFNRCIAAISHMGKKKCAVKITETGMCFIVSQHTGLAWKDASEYWCAILIPYSPIFESHAFSGLAPDKNEIVLEMNVDQMSKALSHNSPSTKLRLVNKESGPHIRVDVRELGITHDIVVSIIQSRKWHIYDRPPIDDVSCSIFLPATRTVHRMLKCLNKMTTKFVTMKANFAGELHVMSTFRHGDVTIFVSDLSNGTIADQSSQHEWHECKLHVKPFYEFINQLMFSFSRIKLSLLSGRAAESSICQEEFEVSFILGNLRE